MSLLGDLKTRLYRRPRDEFRRLLAWGPQGYFLEEKWKAEMEAAAKTLPALPVSEPREVRDIHFLCGREHWYQAAFCAWSYQRHSRYRIRPVVIDDGTMDAETEDAFCAVFPEAVVRSKATCEAKFESSLPESQYPNVHAWRKRQILFRKLTDVFGADDEWRLLFDADMLFFVPPLEIDNALERLANIIVQRDCWESYGYSRALTESLTGQPLPEAINIGMLLYNGRLTDWDRVEHWLGALETKEGRPYNVTQCMFAMLLAGVDIEVLDKEKYKVLATSPDQPATGRIAEHYVADSKPWYYSHAWRLASHLSKS
jgi:hypothetical protein